MATGEREQPRIHKLRKDAIRRRLHPDPVGWFHEGLRRYDVRAVCIHRTARHYRPIIRILRQEGFQKEFGMALYEVWVRSSGEPTNVPTPLRPGR
jgi:hypothetical protein